MSHKRKLQPHEIHDDDDATHGVGNRPNFRTNKLEKQKLRQRNNKPDPKKNSGMDKGNSFYIIFNNSDAKKMYFKNNSRVLFLYIFTNKLLEQLLIMLGIYSSSTPRLYYRCSALSFL